MDLFVCLLIVFFIIRGARCLDHVRAFFEQSADHGGFGVGCGERSLSTSFLGAIIFHGAYRHGGWGDWLQWAIQKNGVRGPRWSRMGPCTREGGHSAPGRGARANDITAKVLTAFFAPARAGLAPPGVVAAI